MWDFAWDKHTQYRRYKCLSQTYSNQKEQLSFYFIF